MEEFHAPFPPLQRAPLRFQGVFGVANTLYKRSFKSVLFLTLLLLVLPMVLLLAGPFIGLGTFVDALENGGMDTGYPSFLGMFGYMSISSLLSTACAFLIAPAYNGALYLELDQCVEGRQATFGQLLQYAVPLGFKQYYTTFLAYLVIQFAASLLIMLALPIFLAATFIPMIVSTLDSASFQTIPFFLSISLLYIFMLFFAVLLLVFTGSIYPAAVHERIRAFKAVGRSFQLGASRFGRMLGVWSLFLLVLVFGMLAVLLLPLLFLDFEATHGLYLFFAWILIISVVITLFFTPYSGCLSVALYIDAAARKPFQQPRNPYAPPTQVGGAAYGNPPQNDAFQDDAPKPQSIYGQPMPGDSAFGKPPNTNTDEEIPRQ